MIRALAAITVLALAPLASCGDDGGATGGPLDDFVLTAPDGFAEQVPTTTVDVAWTVSAASYGLELDVVSGDEPAIMIQRRALEPGTIAWDGEGTVGARVPAGNYRVLAIALGPDDGAVQTVDGGADHLIVVQGVRFRDRTLSFTGAMATRELVVSTVARSTMELTLVLDPDLTTELDEKPLLTASIPGELAPVARSYPFTGMDASGAPIAAGAYTVAAVIRARGGAITYRIDGPTLTWAP